MKKLFPILLSIFFLLSFPLVSSASTTVDEIKSMIQLHYVGDIDGDLESATTIDEVIEMLDPYSTYFTAEQYEDFTNAIDHTTVGIGVVIEQHEQGILITSVIENGSAFESGIRPGDIIIAVDGRSITGLPIEQAQPLIVGPKNTKVSIQLLREDGTKITKTMVRKSFSIPVVTSNILYGNVGYIHIASFSENAATLASKHYRNLRKQGATSVIVDLQNNGGGYVSTAEQLIGLFPGATNAYTLQFSPTNTSEIANDLPSNYQLQENDRFLIHSSASFVKFPENSRLLVNRFSASASEMTAAALVDQQAAIVYGVNTYGKGTMQTLFELEDGGYLKLTIGEFFGPNGSVVKDTGVTPHIQTDENPIYQAHFDRIVNTLPNDKELTSLKNVQTTKTFTILFNHPLKQPIDRSLVTVTIVELGGHEIETTIEVAGDKMMVTPTEPLKEGGHYMLIVNPSPNHSNGSRLKHGVYTYITVTK